MRSVKWFRDVSRTNFSQGALYEIGSSNLIDAQGPARQRSERVAPTNGEAAKHKPAPG